MAKITDCFLSDENGNPILPRQISYSEVQNESGRSSETLTLASGEPITLEKVTISIEGFVTIIFDTDIRTTVPFSFIKQFLLCAPNFTYISCIITDFDCFTSPVNVGETFTEIRLNINLCLSVQSKSDVVAEITGDLCHPRPTLSKFNRCNLDHYFTKLLNTIHTRSKKVNETFCIRIPKVYDWVVTQINIPSIIVPTSCVYEIVSAEGNCEGLTIGDQVCKPCASVCDDILICSSPDCILVLNRLFTNCVPCPSGAVTLPDDFDCIPPAGRVYNVNQNIFYNDIQPAIDDAASGDTLLVFPGTFEETDKITVDKPLTITGLSAENTIVEFLNIPIAAPLGNFIIAADDVTIRNLHLIGPTPVSGDSSLLRVDNAPGQTLYDNVTIDSLVLEGGRRTAVIKAFNLSITNTTFIHSSNSHAIELRSGSGLFDISNNTFFGSENSITAIIFQVNTPFDTFINATYNIQNNNVTRFSQFVRLVLAASQNISIFITDNVVNHEDRGGASIPFIPPSPSSAFTTISPILIEGNEITNPNPPSNLSVYFDYRFTTPPGAVPADGQIQVYNNTFRVALPWGGQQMSCFRMTRSALIHSTHRQLCLWMLLIFRETRRYLFKEARIV
ncbi:hypothetical protein HXA34_06165 [Salipaludibacillus agaradhaerens]|uniref:hypothetical protein n=1 Tax=Salipaludibacillus agaradhaerens TaxID=76935 RepID=UPI002151D2CF|nr:hypothetical protein [Salipaludibacillus agaradhaerens]MCR6105876.1 hypothetical protein [Salipaludibacillus agaradhaerens]MCR6117911.1 hypothetical protein [Salipaludibacillus agaradhaerens]